MASSMLVACAVDPTFEPTTEPSRGHVRVETLQGPELLAYEVDRDGHAIHEGDLDLGPVSGLGVYGGAARLGELWPDGVVYYWFDSDFVGNVCKVDPTSGDPIDCADVRTRVRNTLATLSARLPIEFIEEDRWSSIEFEWGPHDATFNGRSTHVGMAWGGQSILFRSGHDKNDPDANDFHLLPTSGTITHEVLHSIGLWHEQSRTDRDAYITVNTECIKDAEEDNYEKRSASANLGPYDFASNLHYSDTKFCDLVPGTEDCICPTMKVTATGGMLGFSGVGGLSTEDVNSVYRMYAKPLAKTALDARYAGAITTGDFDKDGYDDMAVGVPGASLDTGEVLLYRGTSVGPRLWRKLTEADFNGTVTKGARFGAALVALDWNADGVTDLAIGAPGAFDGAGAVIVYTGSRKRGLTATKLLAQSSTIGKDESGDRFGEALAAGSLTNFTRTDTCEDPVEGKGFGKRHDVLAVGAPGDRNVGPRGIEQRSGAVYLYQAFISDKDCTELLAAPTRIEPANGGVTGDDFGAALAIGDLDHEGGFDLAIGAPHEAADTGSVTLLHGRLPPEASPILWSAMVSPGATLPGTPQLQFGAALAIGDLDGVLGSELAIGAPGLTGRVIVKTGSIGGMTTFAFLVDNSPEVGDRFGAALAIGDVNRVDPTTDLVIGIPGKDKSAGAIAILRGGVPGLAERTTYRQSDLHQLYDNAPGDRFGSALAIGQLDGRGEIGHIALEVGKRVDLAIGAPGEDANRGELHLMRDTVGGWLVGNWGILDAAHVAQTLF